MAGITRSLLFVAATTVLALSVFPVMAQVRPIVAPDCGFLGMNCTGGETFTGNIRPYLQDLINTALTLIGITAAAFLVYAGYLYITSTGDEENSHRAKRQILYALLGLAVAGAAFILVNAVIARDAAPIQVYILPFIYMALSLVGIVAVAFLIYAGYLYITSAGDEENSHRAKRQILYALLGLAVAGAAFILVYAVIARDAAPIQVYILPFINMALSLVGIVAAAFLIYAGYLYITSTGDEENSTRAKRQIFFALLGIFVAGAAELIANVVIFQQTTDLILSIRRVVNAVLTILGIAAAIYVIVGGVMYITSTGDQDKSSRAKMQIIYAVIGLIVVILSGVAVNLIIRAV